MSLRRTRRNLDRATRSLDRAADGVANFHWGRAPKPIPEKKVARPRGLFVLGQLRSVTYTTRKGRDGVATDYVHAFEGALPLLTADAGGKNLYVVRGKSKFKIEKRGIVG